MSKKKSSYVTAAGKVKDLHTDIQTSLLGSGDNQSIVYNRQNSFNPGQISWITDRLAITNISGGVRAHECGHFVINTAEEIDSDADIKVIVDPYSSNEVVRTALDEISEVIENILSETEKKIVVHCYMGMERSVLAVVWYLTKTLGISIDDAYRDILLKRPIVLDRRNWAI